MHCALANYSGPREAFRGLLHPKCEKRILMFRGESGSGKTALLTHCTSLVDRPAVCVPIQLRGDTVGVAEIFHRCGETGWNRFPAFAEEIASLSALPSVDVGANRLEGSSSISVILQAETLGDRAQRSAALTTAWFKDAGSLNLPLLLIFDTYEQATFEVKEWISGPFLSRAARTEQVRVLIAGQEVPNSNNIEWGGCSETHNLLGVPDAEHWMPVVHALGRRIGIANPESWLAGVCHALNGRPKDIMQVIENLPQEGAEHA